MLGETLTHATTAHSAPVGAVDGRVRLLVVVQQQHAALGVGAEQARALADGRLRLHLKHRKQHRKRIEWCGCGMKRLACAAQPTGSPHGTRGVAPSKGATRFACQALASPAPLLPHLAQRGRLFRCQHQPALCRADGCLAVRQRARHLRRKDGQERGRRGCSGSRWGALQLAMWAHDTYRAAGTVLARPRPAAPALQHHTTTAVPLRPAQ